MQDSSDVIVLFNSLAQMFRGHGIEICFWRAKPHTHSTAKHCSVAPRHTPCSLIPLFLAHITLGLISFIKKGLLCKSNLLENNA